MVLRKFRVLQSKGLSKDTETKLNPLQGHRQDEVHTYLFI
ncbi:hypothetical protein LOK49_LG02G01612 [Camellia lanceoleosa]|uniref:Uncharacterized protein n=1 Tax=Camellia lanceoleosa TaxID=1840588 RepID=A0ACC0IKJ8_9ERIC|nr:hypothetical protein LOK49_LG02G01612 [Camellia lanceoleosa]